MFVFVLAVSTALVVSFLCSIFESVLLSLGHARVKALSEEGSTAGKILERFKQEMDVPIAAILILNTIAHTIGAAVAGATYGEAFDPSTLWIFSIVFTIAVLLLTEIIPKTLGISFANALATPVALAVNGLVFALKPVLLVTRAISRWLQPGEREPVTSLEEIRLLAALGRAEGVVRPGMARMIEGVTELRGLHVSDVLLPRTEVEWLSGQRSDEENIEIVRRSGHSRFPFSPDGEIDNARGIVLAKRLLFHLRDHDRIDWDAIVEQPIIVPEQQRLPTLLRRFQDEQRHLAFVVDEHGGFEGIVTMEDVLEEVVGEIWDETDRRRSEMQAGPHGGWICQGLAETRKVFQELDVKIETDAVTLSGFISERLGAVPKRGDVVEEAGYRFTVERATPRRADRIAIERQPDAAADG